MNSESLKIKKMKKIYCNPHEKKTGIIMLVSDKTDFKTVSITRYKEKHLTMIKRIISTRGYNNLQFLRN